jgi:hypothetical protein
MSDLSLLFMTGISSAGCGENSSRRDGCTPIHLLTFGIEESYVFVAVGEQVFP